MASEIHKKRTGKGFRISEEIVVKEEMYEEEDDDLPRSYRVLGPNMQTSSQDMNQRVEAYLSNKFAMSAMLARTNEEWRQNEINKLFAQSFPNISNGNGSPTGNDNQNNRRPHQQNVLQAQQIHAQQMQNAHNINMQKQMQQAQQQPVPANFTQANQYYNQHQHNRGQSFSGTPSYGSPAPDLRQRHHSAEAQFQPVSSPHNSNRSVSPIDLGSSRSAFTTELPAEAKMFMGDIDANGAFQQDAQNFQNWFAQDPAFGVSDMPRTNIKMEQDDQLISPINGSFDMGDMGWDSIGQSMAPMDEAWSTFINDGAWEADQAAA
jgi:hypothetical protein